METLNFKLVSILLLFIPFCFSYTCQTPDNWLDGDYQEIYGDSQESEVAQRQLVYRKGQLWPGGVVKYRIHPSLNAQDKKELFAAFEEYHKKTCIRFQPANSNEQSFVSIEVDNQVCGISHVGKLGTYQFAKFGQDCRKMDTMVHELGHTLGLKHEHQRKDRDQYIRYESQCKQDSNRRISKSIARGFYDYASQMHYECGSCNGGWPIKGNVTKCGPQRTRGLSVLDADYINDLYECQGCYRHRWVPNKFLMDAMKVDLHNFGSADLDGKELYPCRSFHKGELLIGKYKLNENCWVAIGGTEYELTDNYEVLTIPGGPQAERSQYSLTRITENYTFEQKLGILKSAVVAGSLPWADGSGIGNGYIVFAKLANKVRDTCQHLNLDELPQVGLIGKIWTFYPNMYPRRIYAMAPFCGHEYGFFTYDVLTCKTT